MRFRSLWIVAGFILLTNAASANAQYGPGKWEIAPFVDYESSYALNPQTIGVNVNGLRVDGATSFGAFIDYSLTRNAQAEFMWERNLTSYSAQFFRARPSSRPMIRPSTNINSDCWTCSRAGPPPPPVRGRKSRLHP
nr:hypothetical protein Hi04_10k_c5216_00006 [uncultured bacterium]